MKNDRRNVLKKLKVVELQRFKQGKIDDKTSRMKFKHSEDKVN